MQNIGGFIPQVSLYPSTVGGFSTESLFTNDGDSQFYDTKYRTPQTEHSVITKNLQSNYVQEVIPALKRILVVFSIFFLWIFLEYFHDLFFAGISLKE